MIGSALVLTSYLEFPRISDPNGLPLLQALHQITGNKLRFRDKSDKHHTCVG